MPKMTCESILNFRCRMLYDAMNEIYERKKKVKELKKELKKILKKGENNPFLIAANKANVSRATIAQNYKKHFQTFLELNGLEHPKNKFLLKK